MTTKGRSKEPAYLIPPQSITKANWKILTKGGFLKKSRDLQRRVQEVLLVDRSHELTFGRGAQPGASARSVV